MTWYKSILKENFFGLLIQGATFIFSILFALAIPKIFPPDQFGSFSVAFSIVVLWLGISDIGTSSAIQKIASGLKTGHAPANYSYILRIRLLSLAIFSTLLFLLSDLMEQIFYPGTGIGLLLKLGSGWIFANGMLQFIIQVGIAVKCSKYSVVLNALYQVLRFSIPVLFAFYFLKDSEYLMAGTLAAALISVFVAIFFERRMPALKPGEKATAPDVKGIRHYMQYGYVLTIAENIVQNTDVIILGALLPLAFVSVYKVSLLWISSALFVFPVYAGVISAVHAYESEENSKKVLIYTTRYSFLIGFYLLLLLGLSGGILAGAFYGPEYAGLASLMAIMSLLVIDFAMYNTAYPFLFGRGHVKEYSAIRIFSGLAQIAASIAAFMLFGIFGFVGAMILVRIISSAYMLFRAYHISGSSFQFPSKQLLSFAVALALSYLVFGSSSGYLMGLACALVSTIIYWSASLALGTFTIGEIAKFLPQKIASRLQFKR